jgi:serine/threonine protein kinase
MTSQAASQDLYAKPTIVDDQGFLNGSVTLDNSRHIGLVWDLSTRSALARAPKAQPHGSAHRDLAPDREAVSSQLPRLRARRAREQKGRPLKTAGFMLGRGDVLGRYEIEDMIGIGGMAIVYRAKQLTLGRSVALKLLAIELTSDDFRERFRREGKLAASLDHPNIVPVYDADEADGRLFIAMRLVEGETLAERVRRVGAIPPAKTLALLKPIASALDAAHDAGLVHRDVKPQNMLLSRSDHPYLADFGIAKGDSTSILTSAGAFVGTVNYASPEQISGQELTGRTDIYALTVVLYECLAGRVPFLRDTDVAVLHAHMYEPPPGLPENGGRSFESVDPVIARGMAKAPADRFRSAGELLEAAELALAGTTPSAVPPPPPTRPNGHSLGARAGNTTSPGLPMPVAPAAPTARKGNWAARKRPGALLDAAARSITGLSADQLSTRAPEPHAVALTAPAVRAPAPVAERPRRHSRRRQRRRLALATVPAAALLGALALLVIPHGGGSDLQTAQAGLVSLHYPAHWRLSPVQAEPADGVRLADEADLRGPGAALLRAGRLNAAAPAAAGLPPALSHATAGTPAASAVSLDSAHGRLYSGELRSGGRFAAYVFAARAGDVALICEAGTPGALAGCARVVSDSRVGGKVLAAEPDAAVAARLWTALAPLPKARGTGLTSRSLTNRANAAASLAAADRGASRAILKVKAGPRRAKALRDVATAMTAQAVQLDRLGSAIRSRDPVAYRAARSGVKKDDASIKHSLAALEVAGYGTKSAPLPALGSSLRIAGSVPRAKRTVVSSGSGGSAPASGSRTVTRSQTTVTHPKQPTGGGGGGSTAPKVLHVNNGHYTG